MISLNLTKEQKEIILQWLRGLSGSDHVTGAAKINLAVSIDLYSDSVMQISETSMDVICENGWVWAKNPDLRAEILENLCFSEDGETLGPSFMEALAYQMLSEEPKIREAAIYCILAHENDINEEILLSVVGELISSSPEVQKDIIRELPNLLWWGVAPKHLIRFLTSCNHEIRDVAFEALHDATPNPNDMVNIAELLHHENQNVRYRVAEFLIMEGQEELIPEGLIKDNAE